MEAAGYPIAERVRAQSLLKLIPGDLEKQVVAKPELETYAQRLAWVRTQLAQELEEVRQVLLAHAQQIYAAYTYYCATERTADAFMLGKRGFDEANVKGTRKQKYNYGWRKVVGVRNFS